MQRRQAVRFALCRFALASVFLVTAAQTALGQSVTPEAGEGSVSLVYQNYYLTGHYSVEGRKTPNGATHSKAMSVEFEYGLTDRLTLTVVLPYIASKYTGPRPSYVVAGRLTFPGPLDDGSYHGAVQDLRLEVRRSVTAGPVALAPLVGVVIPTHDYETIGEAVPGRNRRELVVGTNAAMRLDPLLPRTYVHVRYALAAAEKLRGYPAVRSIIDLEGGRPITSWLSARGIAKWQLRHKAPAPAEFFDDWVIHDRFMVSSFTNVGGGITLSLTPSTELYAVGMATVSGRFGAHIARLLTLGITWNFGETFGGFGSPSASRAPRTR